MPIGIPIALALTAAGGVASSVIGSNAASTAASQQAQSAQQALDFQKQTLQTQEQNQAPFQAAGVSSLGQLMQGLQSGQFTPPTAPTFTGSFTPPTLEEAQQTPGYQFTAQQGNKGILQGAGAAGGAISGGTLRALDQYNTGLADSTYNDVFNRSLQTYGAGVTGYQQQLAQYQATLQGQAQQYQQLLAPAQLGEQAAGSLNNSLGQGATNVGNLMTSIGNANAAGTVGSANAITSGISGTTSNLLQQYLISQLFKPAANTSSGSAPSTGTLASLPSSSVLSGNNLNVLYGIGPGEYGG